VDDVMTAAREAHGLERMDQVKWAVLECSGGISVVPYEPRPPTSGNSPATTRPAVAG
jgi:uncharacterized membrane protein YcaP (DUF421 family)